MMNIIIECTKMLQKNEYDFWALFTRGIAYYEMGEYENALCDFNEVVNIDPYCNAAYYYLGAISEKNNKNN